MIRGLDITVALDLGRQIPEDRLRIVLGTISEPKNVKRFGADLTGVELRAEDMDWSFGSGCGSGALVFGQAQDLALVLFGRKLPAGRLRGELGARFTS